MENKNTYLLKKEEGQSTVEYVLLLAVAASLASVLLRSDFLNNMLTENSYIGRTIKGKIEYSYRNAGEGKTPTPTNPSYPSPSSTGGHPSYTGGGEKTRFFGPKLAYPN